jgi:hypothetical protein
MSRFDGSLARKLDFGETTTTARQPARTSPPLALRSGALRGPDKYKVLEHRRRQAQIKARRLLDLVHGE